MIPYQETQKTGQRPADALENRRFSGEFEVSGSRGDPVRQEMIRTTYLYLSVAVFGCMAGAYLGSHSEGYLKAIFSGGLLGWLAILLVINLVPAFALRVAENSPRWAVPALGFDGFVSGLALAPLVFLGLSVSGQRASGGDLVSTAIVVTGAMFAAVTAYVFLNRKTFQTGPAVGWGLFAFAVIAVPVNHFLGSSLLSLAISAAVGLLGLWQVARATGVIANDPNFRSPAAGALVLFAGVFNLFTAILRLLLASNRD